MALSPGTIEAIQALMQRAGLREEDLQEQFILGSGSGGQKINKTSSAVRLLQRSSMLAVKVQQSRFREENRWLARRALAELILEQREGEKSRKRQEQEKIRRQKRRRSRRQKARMLEDKSRHAEKKANRRWRAE
ncbi:MAG: peptide chain release factor-like protein [Kiritimatiellae bacterium]|nr:peptide chain release factor-like protein [Kiritimatiellia bacterium]